MLGIHSVMPLSPGLEMGTESSLTPSRPRVFSGAESGEKWGSALEYQAWLWSQAACEGRPLCHVLCFDLEDRAYLGTSVSSHR